jgi:acetolactate synthase-1/2/3 large subunit
MERLAYVPELASVQLRGLKHLILVDAKAPVSFFAYPGRDSYLVPAGCQVHELVSPAGDVLAALEALTSALDAGKARPAIQGPSRPPRPAGSLTAEKVCQAIGAALPEGAIVSDESQTSGVTLPASTAGGPQHDWLALTGGAIGQGLPVAVGAAVACPERPVFALEADGSALYTIQSLWTMAREGLNVTVVILNNRSYAILNMELARVGAKAPGAQAKAQLDLSSPDIDFVALGRSLGVPSRRVENAEELIDALERDAAEAGPHLIEAVVPPTFTGAQLRAMPYALRALGALPTPLAAAVKDRFYP